MDFRLADVHTILLVSLVYEALSRVAHAALALSPHPRVRQVGYSYAAALANALVCTVGAARELPRLLLRTPAIAQAVAPADEGVVPVALAFAGYLLFDATHLVANYPHLGGLDMVLHHALFATLAILLLGHRLFPLLAATLLLGEASTVPLHVRWFLLHTGHAHTPLANATFALLFFATRVVAYWLAVAHTLLVARPLVASPVADVVVAAVVFGGGLNAVWMRKIVRMATRGGKKKAPTATPCSPSPSAPST